MQITNNQVSPYSYSENSTTQINSINTVNSFDSYLSNTNEKTTTPNNQTSKLVAFIDKYGGFSSLSPTDEKIFREILSDNKLTKEEANSLSYEQVERISESLTTNLPLLKEEIDSMPIVQMGVPLTATRAIGDRQFNEAFYNTLKK